MTIEDGTGFEPNPRRQKKHNNIWILNWMCLWEGRRAAYINTLPYYRLPYHHGSSNLVLGHSTLGFVVYKIAMGYLILLNTSVCFVITIRPISAFFHLASTEWKNGPVGLPLQGTYSTLVSGVQKKITPKFNSMWRWRSPHDMPIYARRGDGCVAPTHSHLRL
jgi:hypothetical protein